MKEDKEWKQVVLFYGESTGHVHTLPSQTATYYKDPKSDDYFLQIKASKPLSHQEHNSFVLPEKTYRVRQVKEYDYFTKMTQPVID